MCKSPEEAEISRAINCAVPGVVVSPTVKQENNQNSKYRKKKIHSQTRSWFERKHTKKFFWAAIHFNVSSKKHVLKYKKS